MCQATYLPRRGTYCSGGLNPGSSSRRSHLRDAVRSRPPVRLLYYSMRMHGQHCLGQPIACSKNCLANALPVGHAASIARANAQDRRAQPMLPRSPPLQPAAAPPTHLEGPALLPVSHAAGCTQHPAWHCIPPWCSTSPTTAAPQRPECAQSPFQDPLQRPSPPILLIQ